MTLGWGSMGEPIEDSQAFSPDVDKLLVRGDFDTPMMLCDDTPQHALAIEVARELTRARSLFPLIHSPHEGLAIIEEEWEEFKKEVWAFNPIGGNVPADDTRHERAMKPSVYLAASFSRQAEMRTVAERLKAVGVECTSRWLHEDQSIHTESLRNRPAFLKRCALTDIEDVRQAGVFVRFSDTEEMGFPLVRSSLATGARHFETGLAWAIGRPIIIVGGHQNVFDWLDDNLVHLPDTNALIDYFTERVN